MGDRQPSEAVVDRLPMRSICSVSIVFSLALFGCEKEESSERSAEPIASVDKAAAIDPALAKAVAQASAGAKAKRGPVATAGGPPPSGVFEPGAADREARLGAPPKLTLGERGSEPRVTLGPIRPKPGWKAEGNVQVVLQANDPRGGALPVQLALSLEAQKAKPGDAGADAAASADTVTVTARVKSAEVASAGVSQELGGRVAALKGARVDYQIASDGSGTGYRYDLPGAAADLLDYLRVLSDTLALVTLPVPNVPLGQGGYWMTTSREGVFGLDLVTYRMIKVEKLEGDQVTLSVGTKRYAANNRFEFAGLAADAPRNLVEFDAKSEGRLEFKVGAPFPSGGEVGSLLAARLGTEQQSGVLQIQSRVGLSFPEKGAPASAAKPGTTRAATPGGAVAPPAPTQ